MKIRFNTEEGFTLLELMICVTIIGILSAIAIPSFLAYREKAKIAQATSDLKTFQLAIMNLALDTTR